MLLVQHRVARTTLSLVSVLVLVATQTHAAAQPVVAGIRVVGLHRVSEQHVRAVLQLQTGQPYRDQLAALDAERIKRLGLFSDVRTDIVRRASGVDVEYRVVENPIVLSVRFEGNTRVSSATLEALMDTATGSVLNTNTLRDDVRRIDAYYDRLGFLGTKHVQGIRIESDGAIDIALQEGMLVAQVEVSGNALVPTAAILGAIETQPGSEFAEALLQEDFQTIERLYQNKGYFVEVDGEPDPDHPGTVRLDVCEVRVGAVEITGNTRTKDYAIRRLLALRPGDFVSTPALKADYAGLEDAQLFKEVHVATRPFPAQCGWVALVWTVTEAKSASMTEGLSYQGAGSPYGRGLAGNMSIDETNVNGTGDSTLLSVQRGGNGSQVDFGFTIPYLHRYRADSLSVSVFNNSASNVQYALYKEAGNSPYYGLNPTATASSNSSIYALSDQHQSGINLSLGHPVATHTRMNYQFESLRESETFNAVGIPQSELDATPYASSANLRGVGLNLVRDTRDNRGDPRYGGSAAISDLVFTKLIGSQETFNQVDLDVTRFLPVGAKSTFAAHFNGGFISNPTAVPYTSLFSLSDQQLRGQQNILYGNRELLGQFELRTPVTSNHALGVVFFVDTGNVRYANNAFRFQTDAGLGLRIHTPLFPQPIRVDFARSSSGSHISFGIGQAF